MISGSGALRRVGPGWWSVRLSHGILANDRGGALLFALLVVIVLAATVFAFSDASQLDARLARNFRDGMRALYLARAGVEYAMAILAEDDNDFDTLFEEWAQGTHELKFDGGIAQVRILDEERKLNLNLLTMETDIGEGPFLEIFQRLFDELAVSRTFLAYLIDWMDPDSDESAPGGEGGLYEDLPRPYPVKNAPMDTLTELAAVGGVGDSIFEKLAVGGSEAPAQVDENPYLTVYSSEEVNINTANAVVLTSLSPVITGEVAQKIVSCRETHPFEEPSDLRDVPVVRDVFGDIQDIITTHSQNFLIVATAEVDGVVRRITAHVERIGEEVSIQYWCLD